MVACMRDPAEPGLVQCAAKTNTIQMTFDINNRRS